MKTAITIFLLTTILLYGCKKENTNEKGILAGTITVSEGNDFPNPLNQNQISTTTNPYATTIAITKPSSEYNDALLITKTNSSDNGVFQITLPVGEYSVFILDKTSNQYNCFNQCTPILIKNNYKITIEGNINHITN